MPEDAGVNGLAPHVRVREMQTKLHRWAVADPGHRFDDLYNLARAVRDAAVLVEIGRVYDDRSSAAACTGPARCGISCDAKAGSTGRRCRAARSNG